MIYVRLFMEKALCYEGEGLGICGRWLVSSEPLRI